ncbi:unnamed protein product [Adineta steineri]|uniref:Polyketide synthase n=1 Tax=Adineta steineri TaxID=433720 RepID=A0A815AH46_9BILA|nr:unnamed protein product [Adineta steineri]CAF1345810.1 unnamed protein product [Adineta steineri]
MAVQCLRTNEADMAVCGGVNGIFTPESFLQHSFLGAQSPDGRSRSFSVDANSYAKDDGLDLLLLKQLSDAERGGDPIEANCLDRFFNRSNLDPPLLLGSLKSNLGHTEGAADVISLIKVAMCMYHRGITANMQFTSLNPKLEAQKYNLHILQNFILFPSVSNNDKIAIGVNSFETVGSTTHSIIEEYQPINKTSIQNGHIDDGNHIKIINNYKNKLMLFLLKKHYQISQSSRPTKSLAQKICFVFSGQSPPWWSMGRQSYESEPLFNKWIHLTDAEMTKINKGEWRLLEELIEKKNEQESRINDTNIAQPTLFAIQVALAVLLVSWNIYSSFIISHSAGDQAAAFVAGIEHLACIAVVNSPRSVTISGDEKTIDEIQHILSISYPNVFTARLRIENAFHSYQMNRFDIEKEMLSSLKHIRGFPIQDQKQIFDPICAKAKLYSSVIGEQMNDNIPVDGQYWWSNVRQPVRFYDAIVAIIKDEAANVFLEISPHPVLAKSIRECYELTNQQQSSSPLILPTLKRKENKQITLLTSLAQLTISSQVWQRYFHTRQILLLKNHEEYFDNFPLYKFHLSSCWYESKDSSIQRLANRIPTHPLLHIRQLNDQTSATWKSLININLAQHSFLKDHKIQDAILFPAVVYLELATAACQQLLSSKEDDREQQPTIIFEDIKFVKVLILNEHELVEVFTQIIMPMREWYIIFCNQDNFNKYSLNEFTLHVQVILPGVETTFLPVRIQKFIYSNKTKIKINQSTNIEVRGKYHDNICGIGQEEIYSLDLWIFPMDNKIEEPIFTFEGAVIQQVQGAHSGRWSMEQIIYDKLNLTTDLPNTDHKTYLDTIIKDYYLLSSPKTILSHQLNSISNQDLIESIQTFNELAASYAEMAIKNLDLNQQHHPLLNALTWNSTQLHLIQLIERFSRLKPVLIILNKYGLYLKDILSGEKNGLDIFLGDDEIKQIFHSICEYLQLQYEQQQTKDNSFENYRLRIFWLTDNDCSDILPILDLFII